MSLRLQFRRRWDDVAAAVSATIDRLPEGHPRPGCEGRYLVVPLHPDVVDLLLEELEARGLKFLASRVMDPVRWR